MSTKSNYAKILNGLCEMQNSPAYAVRRQVLAEAELAIVDLEDRCAELLDALTIALPYVEEAEKDPGYKPGTVAKVTFNIRALIAKAEADNARRI